MTWSIEVESLSKLYRLGRGHRQRFDSFYEVVTDKFLELAERATDGRSRRYLPERTPPRPVEIQSEHMVLSQQQFEGAPPGHFWALKDVSFRVEPGQRIGIIGKNGSGKSTLLKILSRITTPTEGQFRFRGRLISLLEIGTGFHPDLTGRENVYLNAKINGLTDRQIRDAFDDIVEFSELGVQIDTPIKRYSSGMYMRLAFSVAAHLDSEILVVDEVLAVGDTGFQKKCLTKMLEIGNSGRTLLFVSHDMDAVRKLCSSAVELSHGRIVSHEMLAKEAASADGGRAGQPAGSGLRSVSTAIADYSLEGKIRRERTWTDADAPRSPSERLSIRRLWVEDAEGGVPNAFVRDQEVVICMELALGQGVPGYFGRVDIASISGRVVSSTVERVDLPATRVGAATLQARCRIPSSFFNAGIHRVSFAFADLLDSSETCNVAEGIHIVVEDRSTKRLPLAPAPEAPLGPAFKWTVG